ncbi:Uncharacterised protein [Burkholderia pseudomallei]|nr:Uncharacterised protein [Burkholderia pseudomallei]
MNKPKSNVTDIKDQLFWKKFEDRMKRDHGVDVRHAFISNAGITRLLVNGDGTSSKDDGIAFDAETSKQVARLFTQYGFPPEPKTWAEYQAPVKYIQRIAEAVDTFRIGYPHIPEHGWEFMRIEYGDIFDAVKLAIEDDYEGLVTRHKRHGTFARLVQEYDGSKELPPPSEDDSL